MLRPWFEEHPGWLEEELKALDAAGYKYVKDSALQEAGRIVLTVKYPIDDDIHDLVVVFPDFYPYFPFQILAPPSFPEGTHKHPYNGLLCILQDPQQKWETKDTIASILDTKVRDIVKAHQHPKDAESLEAHEGAQATGYFAYVPSAVIFTGDWNIPKEHTYGRLLIGLDSGTKPNEVIRGAVLEVQDKHGNILVEIDPVLKQRYSHRLPGRWVRLPKPPVSDDGNAIFNEAAQLWPEIARPKLNNGPDIVGLLFPEEVQYTQHQENWVFIVRRKAKQPHDKRTHIQSYLARADRASRANNYARVNRCGPIENKKVLLIGLGAIGSICAWQLARAGVGHIHLLDYDHLQLGNSPRWLLGYDASGHNKADVLKHHLERQYPFVKVTKDVHKIGDANSSFEPKQDIQIIERALNGTDLVLDATAEKCVSHFLSDLARKQGIPYLWATGTPGSWGGTVGRIVPDRTEGCWKCYQGHLFDKSIKTPAQENVPNIQPVGCFHPTFTGTGFDMDHISLGAVRLAVSTLCAGSDKAYPDFDWDIGIVDLWDEKTGKPIAPEWHKYALKRHPDCECHA